MTILISIISSFSNKKCWGADEYKNELIQIWEWIISYLEVWNEVCWILDFAFYSLFLLFVTIVILKIGAKRVVKYLFIIIIIMTMLYFNAELVHLDGFENFELTYESEINAGPPLNFPQSGDYSNTIIDIRDRLQEYIRIKSQLLTWTGNISNYIQPDLNFWKKFERQTGYTLCHLGEFHQGTRGVRGYAIFVEWNSKLAVLFDFNTSVNTGAHTQFEVLDFPRANSADNYDKYINNIMEFYKQQSPILSQVPRSKIFWMLS